jgi:uncharacterized protein (TIGR02453 family)
MVQKTQHIMNATEIISFLNDLKANNNREWFHANKKRFESARAGFESFAGKLIPAVAAFDSSIRIVPAKDCLFRIFRDTRFSHDKTPYKTNFGAFIAPGGRKSSGPGYYFHIEPGDCFLAGGVYMPPPALLKAMRAEIYYNVSEFKEIINKPAFRKFFGEVQTYEKLTRPPKDFPKDFPDIELLKHKSYIVVHAFDENQLDKPGFFSHTVTVFKGMLPFNRFLQRAADGCQS